jgi:hypothetical protein
MFSQQSFDLCLTDESVPGIYPEGKKHIATQQ